LEISLKNFSDTINSNSNSNNILLNNKDNIRNINDSFPKPSLNLNNKFNSNINKKSTFHFRSNVKNLIINKHSVVSNDTTSLKNVITSIRLNLYNRNYPNYNPFINKNNFSNNSNSINSIDINIKDSFPNFSSNKRKHGFSFEDNFSNSKKRNKIFYSAKKIATINADVPFTFYQSTHCPEHNEWEQAIKELQNLYKNNIMTVVNKIPPNKTLITTKWVFAYKLDSNGNIIKRKARLVAGGFRQRYGIDFELTFSLTLNIDCLKLLFALASKFRWAIFQLDIKAAYLNAN